MKNESDRVVLSRGFTFESYFRGELNQVVLFNAMPRVELSELSLLDDLGLDRVITNPNPFSVFLCFRPIALGEVESTKR